MPAGWGVLGVSLPSTDPAPSPALGLPVFRATYMGQATWQGGIQLPSNLRVGDPHRFKWPLPGRWGAVGDPCAFLVAEPPLPAWWGPAPSHRSGSCASGETCLWAPLQAGAGMLNLEASRAGMQNLEASRWQPHSSQTGISAGSRQAAAQPCAEPEPNPPACTPHWVPQPDGSHLISRRFPYRKREAGGAQPACNGWLSKTPLAGAVGMAVRLWFPSKVCSGWGTSSVWSSESVSGSP